MRFMYPKVEHFQEIAMNTGVKPMADSKGIAVVDDSGELQAGAIFDSFTHSSCQAHLYVYNKMVFRHGFLEEVANYLFNTCNLQVILGKVPEDNEAALRLNQHMGFEELFRIKDAIAIGVSCVIMQLRREDCRYLMKEAA